MVYKSAYGVQECKVEGYTIGNRPKIMCCDIFLVMGHSKRSVNIIWRLEAHNYSSHRKSPLHQNPKIYRQVAMEISARVKYHTTPKDSLS